MPYRNAPVDLLQCRIELSWALRQIVPTLRHPDGKKEALHMAEQLSLITTGVVFAFLGAIVIGIL